MSGTKINIHILDIFSMLSKSNTQLHLVKQPRPIPKVVLEEVGASGKRRRCEWLQMRSSCCQRTGELEHLSSRAAEQNEDDTKRKRDPTVRRNVGFFSSIHIAAPQISANTQLHTNLPEVSTGPNNNSK